MSTKISRAGGAPSKRRSRETATGRGASIGTAPQRPPDAAPSPGPSSYRPATLDETARDGKVVSIGGRSKRELFPPSPETPGPEQYAPEVIQGSPAAAAAQEPPRRVAPPGRAAAAGAPSSRENAPPPRSTNPKPSSSRRRPLRSTSSPTNAPGASPAAASLVAAAAGTFGSSERFPRDAALRPGVGDYDLRAAEAAACGSSTAVPPTLGRKPTGAPYDPALSRYLFRDDGRVTPSSHAYRPESARGGGGDGGLAGHASAPPGWSFGGKRPAPRPPDGPGPGKFRPPYNNESDPCCSSSPARVRFGVGREDISGSVSGVPWVEAEERAARGEAGGRSARLYLPERDRMGSRVFMRSRRLPRPGTRGPR
ncbi:unnamed protein product [Ectocarpus sp. CCAP 1310/34]|nr:unnamed protein product [Ectocarpus sp. CCAP 1310/34]